MDRQPIVDSVRPAVQKLAIVGLMFGGAVTAVTGCKSEQAGEPPSPPPPPATQNAPLDVGGIDIEPDGGDMYVQCLTLEDAGSTALDEPRVVGHYLIVYDYGAPPVIQRLPDGVACPKPGDLRVAGR